MTLVISKGITLLKERRIPTVLGEPWEGGFFAGYISHTADGNPTHALIVAPRATGATGTGYTLTTNLQWKMSQTTTVGSGSVFDGAANTAAIATAGIADHPAAQFCVGLSIGGFTDWYLPSRAELNIAYFNLKPTIAANNVNHGANIYAVPSRAGNWLANYPIQSYVTTFAGGAEAFDATFHWSSTQEVNSQINNTRFSDGAAATGNATGNERTRAFRRIAL